MEKKKKVLSCIQPTGELHLGNYFGAVRNWVNIQNTYDCIYGVVDLHAMTMSYDPKQLKENTLHMAIGLLACGIDPEKSIVFIQSLVPQHTELAWIFNCIASYGELSRMTQFKDKTEQIEENEKKGRFISGGLFTYPVLQAADILIYKANYVPVGKDQEQHLELSRNIAVRFNKQFGECFPEPQPLFTELPKLMSLADPTKKMSKSLGDKHFIGLFEDKESIRKKIRSAVTDTGELIEEGKMSPGVENLFFIMKACGKMNEHASLSKEYFNGTLKYKELKDVVADAVIELTTPLRLKKEELERDMNKMNNLIYDLSAKAQLEAKETLKEVRRWVGLPESG